MFSHITFEPGTVNHIGQLWPLMTIQGAHSLEVEVEDLGPGLPDQFQGSL